MEGFLTEGAFPEVVRQLQDDHCTGRVRFTAIDARDGRPKLSRHVLVLREGRVIGVEGDSALPAGAANDRTQLLLHAALALTDVLSWKDGTFAFAAEELDGGPADAPTLDAVGCSAVTAVRDVEAVRHALGPTGGHFKATRAPRPDDSAALLPADAFVLTRLSDVLSSDEIDALLPDPDGAAAVLLRLRLAGLVEEAEPPRELPRPPRAVPAPPPPAPRPAPVAAAPKPAIDLRVVVAAAAAAVAPAPPRPDPPGEPTPAGRLPVAILRAEVQQSHAGLAGASHFQVLGLMREATLDDVRQAYRTLVRRYHPDGYADPAVADLREKAVALFVAVGEAYAVLSDPGRRGEYERDLQRKEYQEAMRSRARAVESGVVADSHASAAVHLARAEEALGTGQTAEAIRILEAVLPTLQPPDRGRGQVLLGRAYMTDPNPHRARDAERILQDVLRDDPRSVDAQVCLGTLYGQRGLRNRARRMYRAALEIDPMNAEASREITRMDQEDAPPAPEPQKPLLARLFRPR